MDWSFSNVVIQFQQSNDKSVSRCYNHTQKNSLQGVIIVFQSSTSLGPPLITMLKVVIICSIPIITMFQVVIICSSLDIP
jgi:hypothetical protein